MKIEKIKLVEVDDSLPLLQPSRVVEIKTDKGTVSSPNRCATSYEFNRKAELPTATTIDNTISTYTKKFTGREVIDLLNTNEEYGKQLRAIEKADRVTEYSILHACTFQLAESSSTGKSPLEILSDGKNLQKFLRFLIDMQYDAKHDIISIPPLNLPLSILQKTLRDANNAIEKLGKQALFSFDLKYKEFPSILDYTVSEFQSNIINLIYRKRRDFPQHYDHLRNYARKDIAFLMTSVDRIDFQHDALSTMHYMPFLGNDFFAVEIPPFAIPKKGAPKKNPNLANLKVLNSDDLTVNSIIDNKVSKEKILEEIGNPVGDELGLRISNIDEAKTDDSKYKILNALTRVHELKASSKELMVLSDHVKERSSKEYVKSKNGFEVKLSRI